MTKIFIRTLAYLLIGICFSPPVSIHYFLKIVFEELICIVVFTTVVLLPMDVCDAQLTDVA